MKKNNGKATWVVFLAVVVFPWVVTLAYIIEHIQLAWRW